MARAALYVISTETFSGKSALSVGVGKFYSSKGLSVGYMKPLSVVVRPQNGGGVDEDTAFVKQTFSLAEPLTTLSPVLLTPARIRAILSGEETQDFRQEVQSAYERAASGKDIMILEGANDWLEGALVNLPAGEIAGLLGCKALVTIRYEGDMAADDILAVKQGLGDMMIGCVINAVPRSQIDFVEESISPFLERKGVKVFAVLPQDRVLLAISVNQLAEYLGGTILCCQDRGEELVENLMVGAMNVDSALSYFRRRTNKAIITGGDRADIQLAALETSTKCIILTGNLYPNPVIVARAEELGVPLILVKQDTLTAVESIEQIFGKVRFQQARKIERLETMLEEHLDFPALSSALGLSA